MCALLVMSANRVTVMVVVGSGGVRQAQGTLGDAAALGRFTGGLSWTVRLLLASRDQASQVIKRLKNTCIL